MAMLYLVARGSNFHEPDLKERHLTSEVLQVTGSSVRLKLSGRVVLEADDRFNQNKYRASLLGYATYDTNKRTFTAFDLVAYGMHTIGERDMAPDGPDHIPIGFLFTLNGSNVNDDQVPTKFGVYRYAKLKSAR
jgi:hypothetical protein